MTALVLHRGLADSLAELFAPVDDKPIETLLAEHSEKWETIDRIAGLFADESVTACLPHFTKGNEVTDRYTTERMFGSEGVAKARRALAAVYWSRALEITDVLSVMPAKRRDEWHNQIHACDVPPFTADAIRTTLREHLAARHTYFAERVDGLFRALSPNHKTNLAAGFRSKMILEHITNEWFHATRQCDYLSDLRIVVARFMGREVEREYDVHDLTRRLVEMARRTARGEWVTIDGGAIEVRLYDNGNCHVRVHDELAWRLNAVLASVNPGAIPESNQTRPAYTSKRKAAAKPVDLMLRPLPFTVIRTIAAFSQQADGLGKREWQHDHTWSDLDKHLRTEVLQVLASIGAVEVERFTSLFGRVRFDYDATEVLRELIASGVVPDQRAHQFYPTPRWLAERVVALAEIGPEDTVLEPSAGQGGIAELLPRDRTVCVEASALHCAVLRAKGVEVVQGDFLRTQGLGLFGESVTRIVMNPPFDRGQWKRHVEHAAGMLAGRGARLVAVLPSGAATKLVLPGFTLTWSEPIDGAFIGTNVSVVLLLAVKQG